MVVYIVSHSIWLGKMNKIDERVKVDSEKIREEMLRIKREQGKEAICQLYRKLEQCKLIRWKESIKDIIGLPRASIPGLDI